MADDILDFMIRHGLVAKYATGGPVEEIDAPGLGQRLHAPDDDILGYIMNQQAVRAQGAIPPVDWAGDLSGVDRRRLVPPRPVKKADGGAVSAGDNPEISYSPEQIQAALAYLALMQSQRSDEA
jgi:hypothetical protein